MKKLKKIIGFTCGSFDLLHAGQILIQKTKLNCHIYVADNCLAIVFCFLSHKLQTNRLLQLAVILKKFVVFEECKKVCDYLIVGLQSDPSLDRKQKNKPVETLEEREIILKSVKYIDEIKMYNTEEELYSLLKEIKPDVRIIGEDWEGKQYTGYDLPIKVYFNKRDHKWSTSYLRKRVYDAESSKHLKHPHETKK